MSFDLKVENKSPEIKLANLSIKENDSTPSLSSFVDLSNPDTMKKYLGPEFQSQTHTKYALQIAERIYEAQPRSIRNVDQGVAFPMNPELLAYAMQLAKGEYVLEIAGASGENAILLAFSGAKKVYMNDIDPGEFQTFRQLEKQLPPDVKERIEGMEGSCLDILKNHPQLENKFGLILCRNLIHFFDNKQQAEFMDLLKKLLKPQGCAIFTVNASHGLSDMENRTLWDQKPNETCITIAQCFITDYALGTFPKHIIFRSLMELGEDQKLGKHTTHFLYKRDKETDFKWKVNNEVFQQLPDTIRKRIKEVCTEHKQKITEVKTGSVRVVISTQRAYNEKNLPAFFMHHGFKIESSFALDMKGHLIGENRVPDKNDPLIGVVVRFS